MRDMAQDLMDRFAGFVRGHSSGDRGHPGVGVAFIVAAVLVLLLGLRWFSGSDGAGGSTDQSWALDVSSGGPTTTIGASPEAVAVRVGTAIPHGAEEDPTVTIGIPGTSIEIEIPLGPTTTTGPGGTSGGTTGGTSPTTRPGTPPPTRPGGGGTTTTPPATDPPVTDPPVTDPPPTDPPPTDPPSTDPTTTEEPTTEPPPPELADLSIAVTEPSDPVVPEAGDLVDTLIDSLDSLLS